MKEIKSFNGDFSFYLSNLKYVVEKPLTINTLPRVQIYVKYALVAYDISTLWACLAETSFVNILVKRYTLAITGQTFNKTFNGRAFSQ
jgi:hypothetical protein